jgi:ribosomal protein S1
LADDDTLLADDDSLMADADSPSVDDGPLPAELLPAAKPRKPAVASKAREPSVLTIVSRDEVETQQDRDDIVWHDIQNALRTRRVLTGILDGIERLENGNIIAVVYYKDLRVIIPVSEMMIFISEDNYFEEDTVTRQGKILGNSIGAEIDFIVKGIDSKTRSAVASRKLAMMKKRKTFYLDPDANGRYRVHEGRIVQARVIAVTEKALRVEIFGVETSIMARDITYDWLGDARDRHSVGDKVLVRIQEVQRDSIDALMVKADIKSVTGDTGRDNIKKCKVQGKYVGKVTDIHKGVVFIRLGIGVNAIAHSCFDNRAPGKKDNVSFAVTHIDEDRNIAVGIITRIIKQNL